MNQHIHLALHGSWSLLRQDRETGALLEEIPLHENTVLTAGKDEFLDLMFGLGGSQYTQANVQLKLYDAADALIKTLACKAGYPVHGADDSGTVEWWFEDISIDVYTPDRLDLGNTASAVIFSRKDPSGLGAKPNSENWIYKYTLSITQNGDTDLRMDGLDRALRIMTGDQALSFSDPDLLVENIGATVTSTVSADVGSPSRAGETVTVVFTAASGAANQEWYTCAVGAILPDAGWTEINRTVEDLGAKTSAMVRVYTFTFSL